MIQNSQAVNKGLLYPPPPHPGEAAGHPEEQQEAQEEGKGSSAKSREFDNPEGTCMAFFNPVAQTQQKKKGLVRKGMGSGK